MGSIGEVFTGLTTIPIILLSLGVVLILVEMSIPGFGVAGICSIVCFVVGIALGAQSIAGAIILSTLVLLFLALVIVFFALFLSKRKLSSRLILRANNGGKEGFTSSGNYSYLCDQTGRAQTALRPAGRALINGKVYDVVSSAEYIEAGTPVTVTEVNGSRIVVSAVVLSNSNK